MRYFRRSGTSDTLNLPGGTPVKFSTIDRYSYVAAVDNPGLEEALLQMLHAGQGGLTEISAKDYEELKKNSSYSPQKRVWREEMANSFVHHAQSASVPSVNAVPAQPVRTTVADVPTAQVQPAFQPVIGKRFANR